MNSGNSPEKPGAIGQFCEGAKLSDSLADGQTPSSVSEPFRPSVELRGAEGARNGGE